MRAVYGMQSPGQSSWHTQAVAPSVWEWVRALLSSLLLLTPLCTRLSRFFNLAGLLLFLCLFIPIHSLYLCT